MNIMMKGAAALALGAAVVAGTSVPTYAFPVQSASVVNAPSEGVATHVSYRGGYGGGFRGGRGYGGRGFGGRGFGFRGGYGGRGYGFRGGYGYRGYGYRGVGVRIGLGFGRPAYRAVYPVVRVGGGGVAYCLAHYRSYSPATHTYVGYDGLLHRCP